MLLTGQSAVPPGPDGLTLSTVASAQVVSPSQSSGGSFTLEKFLLAPLPLFVTLEFKSYHHTLLLVTVLCRLSRILVSPPRARLFCR